MKVLPLFLILASLILINCESQVENDFTEPIVNYEANKIDNSEREELAIQNEKFRIVPDNIKEIDFS